MKGHTKHASQKYANNVLFYLKQYVDWLGRFTHTIEWQMVYGI